MFSLLRYLIEYVTLMLNFEPNSQREDPTRPYKLFRWQKIDYKRQLRIISFGDYAECHDPHVISNTMERRTDPCIALLLLLNAQGSHLFYNLETRRTCVRDTWSEVPFPADILKRINKLAAGQRKKLRVQPNFAYDPEDEENNLLEHIDDNDLFVEGPADKSIDSSSDDNDEDDEGRDNIQTHKLEDTAEDIIETRTKNEANIDLDGHINPVDRYKPQDLYAETTPEEHVHPRESLGTPPPTP